MYSSHIKTLLLQQIPIDIRYVRLQFKEDFAIGYGWYWWKTRGDDADLGKPLLCMPLIAAAFVWFPAVLFPQLTGPDRVQVFLLLAGASLVVGYLWVAVVRFILRVWRKV